MSVQLLVTTMHQTDFSKAEAMNIQTDAILANQADRYDYQEKTLHGRRVQLITTPTRGLSVNRNIALTNLSLSAEFILFSDDDLCFFNDYEGMIEREFAAHPQAEAILFGLECVSERKLSRKEVSAFTRASRIGITASGVWGLAIRREVLLKNNLHFNQYFGSGTEYYCGEDSIFLQDMLKRGVRLYRSPVVIAQIDQGESTWYEGETDKRFRVAGMVLAAIYPTLSPLLAVRSAYRKSRQPQVPQSFSKLVSLYWEGIRQFKSH